MARQFSNIFVYGCLVCAVSWGCRPPAKPSTDAPPTQASQAESVNTTVKTASTANEVPANESTTPTTPGKSTETTTPADAATSAATDQQVPAESATNPVKSDESKAESPMVKPASWSTQRMVLMGKGGPRFFKLDVNVGGQDLEHGFESDILQIARELSIDFEHPIDWNSLLDKPLIASGWLGNLVPTAEQREQLRGLYDANKDEKVDGPEFRMFVTRGLARNAHLKFATRPAAPQRLPGNILWGPIDADSDGELTKAELEQATESMLKFDFDGDRVLSLTELRSSEDGQDMGSGSRAASMLDLTPVHAWDIAKPQGMARAVTENYSFGEPVKREQLYAWSNARVQQLDSNMSDSVDESEFRGMTDELVDGAFQFTFPNQSDKTADQASVLFRSIDKPNEEGWLSHPEGGRLTLDGCIITVVLSDEQSQAVRTAFEAQFGRFEKDAQLNALAMQALGLKEGAMETLHSIAEERKTDAQELAWTWMVAPRQWHLQITWTVSTSPWFELMDMNGDQNLTTAELEQFRVQAKGWDRNKDGVLQEREMPISILLEVKRNDARGLRSRLGGTASEKRGAIVVSAPTWFTGMDYNSDGELTPSEFLGEPADFEKLDRNRDGIIEAREVTTPQ